MRKKIDVKKVPSAEQLAMISLASKAKLPADSEYPEFSDKELLQFKKISDKNKLNRQKQTITLRLSPGALAKAKSLGKGYTSILSRILESALDNTEVVKRYL